MQFIVGTQGFDILPAAGPIFNGGNYAGVVRPRTSEALRAEFGRVPRPPRPPAGLHLAR